MAALADGDGWDGGWAVAGVNATTARRLSDALAVLAPGTPEVQRRDDYGALEFRADNLRRSGAPVVLRPAGLEGWRATSAWRREALLADPWLARVAVRPSRAPYVRDPLPLAPTAPARPGWTTLGAYVDAEMGAGGAPTLAAACAAFEANGGDARSACAAALRAPPPRCVFQRINRDLAPALLADVSPPPLHFAAPTRHRPRAFEQQRSHVEDAPCFSRPSSACDRPIVDDGEEGDAAMKQLAVAPALSGSPPHIHGAAHAPRGIPTNSKYGSTRAFRNEFSGTLSPVVEKRGARTNGPQESWGNEPDLTAVKSFEAPNRRSDSTQVQLPRPRPEALVPLETLRLDRRRDAGIPRRRGAAPLWDAGPQVVCLRVPAPQVSAPRGRTGARRRRLGPRGLGPRRPQPRALRRRRLRAGIPNPRRHRRPGPPLHGRRLPLKFPRAFGY